MNLKLTVLATAMTLLGLALSLSAQVVQSHSMADNSNQARIATTLNIFQNAIRRGDLSSLLATANHGANLGPANSADSNFYQSLVSYYEQRHRCRGNDIMGGEL